MCTSLVRTVNIIVLARVEKAELKVLTIGSTELKHLAGQQVKSNPTSSTAVEADHAQHNLSSRHARTKAPVHCHPHCHPKGLTLLLLRSSSSRSG